MKNRTKELSTKPHDKLEPINHYRDIKRFLAKTNEEYIKQSVELKALIKKVSKK